MTKATLRAGRLLIAVACLAGSARAAEAEKLLFGFERAEIERTLKNATGTNAENAFEEKENDAFNFFSIGGGQFHEREMAAIRPMRCVKGKASQGAYSCRIAEVIDRKPAGYPTFWLPRAPVRALVRSTPQINTRLPELFNTAGWYRWTFPRDWSGYDLLRVDVLIEQSEVMGKLMLEVEDNLVEPPVSVTCDGMKIGEWMTLEMDLTQAVKERGLNLGAMNNMWIRFSSEEAEDHAKAMHRLWKDKKKDEWEKRKFVAYVDNIRLCKADTPAAYPIMKGTRSGYSEKLPRSYAAEEHFTTHEFLNGYLPEVVGADMKMPEPADVKPEPAPTKISPPSVIPIRSMFVKGCLVDEPQNLFMHNNIRLTCVSALDAGRIAVGFDLYGTGSMRVGPKADRRVGNNACAAVGTTDGGKTWNGLRGTAWPSIIGGNQSKIPPRLWDLGGDIMGVGAFGCLAIRGAHIGYPADRAFFIRSVMAEDTWWISPHYFITGDTRHCHWLWWADVVQSSSGRIWMATEAEDRYTYDDDRSYSVFVYYSDDGGGTWCSWRGAGFTGEVPPFGSRKKNMRYVKIAPYREGVAVFAGGSWSWFNGKEWSALEATGVAVSWYVVASGDEIYLSDTGNPVRWYDGKAWHNFPVSGWKGRRGFVTVCGEDTAVFVARDASKRKLLSWQKKKGGTWMGPEELVSEETQISQAVGPRYAPKGFVPVAYMCLTAAMDGVKSGGKRSKKTPGNQYYYGTPPEKLFWTYPSRHWSYEPWIKVLKIPVEDLEK